MTPSILSWNLRKYSHDKPPRQYFHLNCAYIHYENLPQQYRVNHSFMRGKGGSLSTFTAAPIDILYEIFTYLHPQDILNLSRSTRRLRQLLMTRDARFIWKMALSNVEGMPFCPSDLSEPQFASLAFDEHCHLCLAPGVKYVFWGCRIRCCKNCVSKCFLTKSQIIHLLHEDLDIPRPETIFPFVTYPKANPGETGTVLFYKPVVESYLQQLAKLDKHDHDARLQWYTAKRAIQNEVISHAALCEHWTAFWTYFNPSPHLYDFGFTLSLLGLLVFLWKDKLFY